MQIKLNPVSLLVLMQTGALGTLTKPDLQSHFSFRVLKVHNLFNALLKCWLYLMHIFKKRN